MSQDYYETLGIKRDASKADIKKAFREAAKKHHPDKGGDAEKFKKINEAYETLSDEGKKSNYDRFGKAGAQGGFGGGQGFGGFGGFQGGAQNVNFDDINDIFGSFFGGGFGGNWQDRPRRGSDLEVEVTLTFEEAINGTKKKFKSEYSADKNIEIKIPQGIGHGDTLRMSGKGETGQNGGPAGDLYIHIRVKPSKKFDRRGVDIISLLEISVFDALLGGTFEVETFWGKMDLKVPESTIDGQVMRIKGKGATKGNHTGDHLVKINYKMPKKIGKKLRELLEKAKKA